MPEGFVIIREEHPHRHPRGMKRRSNLFFAVCIRLRLPRFARNDEKGVCRDISKASTGKGRWHGVPEGFVIIREEHPHRHPRGTE